MFWRAYRAGGGPDRRAPRAWVLPVMVVAEVAWALFLWRDYSGFLPWARDAMTVAGVVAVVVLIVARLSRRAQARLATAGLAAGLVAVLAAPAAWAASVLDPAYGGSSLNASAGPAGAMGGGGGGGGRVPAGGTFRELAERFGDRAGRFREGAAGGAFAGAFAGGGAFAGVGAGGGAGGGIAASTATTLTPAEQRIFDYVSAHRGNAGYLLAVGSWEEAAPYILATGQEVMAMGGFSGSVPEPTLAAVQALVHSGQLRFFLSSGTGSAGAGFGTAGGGSVATSIDSWVQGACPAVPAQDYAVTASGTGASGAGASGTLAGTPVLYACGPGA